MKRRNVSMRERMDAVGRRLAPLAEQLKEVRARNREARRVAARVAHEKERGERWRKRCALAEQAEAEATQERRRLEAQVATLKEGLARLEELESLEGDVPKALANVGEERFDEDLVRARLRGSLDMVTLAEEEARRWKQRLGYYDRSQTRGRRLERLVASASERAHQLRARAEHCWVLLFLGSEAEAVRAEAEAVLGRVEGRKSRCR